MASASTIAGTGGTGDPDENSPNESRLPYGDMHRLVLQGIMSAGLLDAKGVKQLFTAACNLLNFRGDEVEVRTSMEYIQQVVRDINERIKPFDMGIRSASCEITSKKFYMFLMTVEKPMLKLQTIFTKFEVALFRKIMDTMLTRYDTYSLPVPECLNLAPGCDPSGTLTQAEAFVNKMLDQNYFVKYPTTDNDFHYTLGVRALRELETILNDHYFDYVTKCSLCTNILLHGILCYQCKLVIHKVCFTRYMKSSSPTSICPQCKCTWTKTKMIMRTRSEEHVDYVLDGNAATAGGSGAGANGVNRASTSTANANVSSATSSPGEDPDMPILSPVEIDLAVGDLEQKRKR